jgi:putative flavoprotein involved in K+ transport
VRVLAVRRNGDGFAVHTENGELKAKSVVVATGAYQRPFIPAIASDVPERIVQLHSSQYRNSRQLPDGDVLVVGAGNSGAQIALELSASRHTWLSGPDTGSIPRRILGRDVYRWLWPTLLQVPVRMAGRRMADRMFAGDPLVGMSAKDLNRATLTRTGKVVAVRDGLPVLDDGRAIDVAAIVWCTGYRPDFSWIELHERGLVPQAPGLAFLGLRYQYRMSSSLLGGVGRDAKFVISALCRA